MALDRLAFLLILAGALNWLLIGLLRFDMIAAIFGGEASFLSRAVYTLIGLAGVWVVLLLRERSRT
ncbi:MAG TPA: DUF378 domain-containing protein [Selenomonadales bacterium]|nr:DUF378 domain-containing protein [Selenomonadales bacterium]